MFAIAGLALATVNYEYGIQIDKEPLDPSSEPDPMALLRLNNRLHHVVHMVTLLTTVCAIVCLVLRYHYRRLWTSKYAGDCSHGDQ